MLTEIRGSGGDISASQGEGSTQQKKHKIGPVLDAGEMGDDGATGRIRWSSRRIR